MGIESFKETAKDHLPEIAIGTAATMILGVLAVGAKRTLDRLHDDQDDTNYDDPSGSS